MTSVNLPPPNEIWLLWISVASTSTHQHVFSMDSSSLSFGVARDKVVGKIITIISSWYFAIENILIQAYQNWYTQLIHPMRKGLKWNIILLQSFFLNQGCLNSRYVSLLVHMGIGCFSVICHQIHNFDLNRCWAICILHFAASKSRTSTIPWTFRVQRGRSADPSRKPVKPSQGIQDKARNATSPPRTKDLVTNELP